MARYDVFISYRTTDRRPPEIADFLEQNGIRCWIAPRDIAPGTPYARAIMEGIEHSEIFMVFISKASLESDDVLNEIDNAHRLKKKLIPVFIEDVEMSKPFGYYLNKTQWVDFQNTSQTKKNELVKTVRNILSENKSTPSPINNPFSNTSSKHRLSANINIWRRNKGCMITLTLCIALAVFVPGIISITKYSNQSYNSDNYNIDNDYNIEDDSSTKTDTERIYKTIDWYIEGLGNCEYIGEVNASNIPEGKGIARWTSGIGKSYDGDWEDGMMDGNGRYEYSSGDIFEGTLARNRFKQGKLTKKRTGEYYEGEFDNEGQPSKGKWYNSEGKLIEVKN